MAIVFIQKGLSSTSPASTTRSVTLAGAVTAGNFIIVGIVSDNSASQGALSTVKDQAANSYTVLGPATNSPGATYLAYRENVPGTSAGTTVITATFANSVAVITSMWAREFSGVLSSASIDGVAVNGTGSGTAINSPSKTPTAGDLLYAVTFSGGTVSAIGGSWSPLDSNIQNGECDEYILSASGSAQAVNWTSSSGVWASTIAAFLPAASGGGVVLPAPFFDLAPGSCVNWRGMS